MKLGVIGIGMVGKAVLQAFSRRYTTFGYDIRGEYSDEKNLSTLISESDVIFVCVPTPTSMWRQNTGALEQVAQTLMENNFKGVVVVKSTVLPKTMESLAVRTGLRLVHNPEFLTAAKAYEDFVQQTTVILSGSMTDCEVVSYLYRELLPGVRVEWYPDFKVTELAKYMRNCFLAVKVAFANEFHQLCAEHKIPYDMVKQAFLSQGGVEPGHFNVPGPDGKVGFSGACLPKDIRAMITHMRENNLGACTLIGAEISNQVVRPHDDFSNEVASDGR